MKIRLVLFALLVSCNLQCAKTADQPSSQNSVVSCGTYKSGQQLYRGPDGGCYYVNSNGNKTYVERSACTCK